MKNHKIYRKFIAPMLAAALAAVIGFSFTSDTLIRAVDETEYVSELRIFEGRTLQNAKDACLKAGFTPVMQDLNEGTSNAAVLLGYQTTKDREDAITDISMMQMGLGYDEISYSKILEAQNERMGFLASNFMYAVDEFRDNYAKHSPAAISAYEIYNTFYVDESSMKLGDYLLSPSCDEDFILKLTTQSSTAFVNMLYATMASGVTDYNPDSVFDGKSRVVEVNASEAIDFSDDLPIETTTVYVSETIQTETTVTESTEDTAETTDTDAETETTTIDTTTDSAADTTSMDTTMESTVETTTETTTETTVTEDSTDETTTTETTTIEETTFTETTTTTEELDESEKVSLVLECGRDVGNWASRIARTGMVKYLEQDEVGKEFDNAFYGVAYQLKDTLFQFTEHYQNAEARRIARGEEALIPDTDAKNPEDVPAELAENAVNNIEPEESDADLLYLCVYDILDQYCYNDEKSVAEYIVSLGSHEYMEQEDYREMYPLVAALTDGQAYIAKIIGLETLTLLLKNPDEIITETEKYLDNIRSQIKDYNGTDTISVWEGVDRSLYQKTVAKTDALTAKQNADAVFERFTEESEFDKTLNSIFSGLSLASQVVGAIIGTIYMTKVSLTFASCAAAIKGGTVLGFIGGVLGTTLLTLSIVLIVAMVIVLLIKLIVWLIDLFDGEDDEEERTPIPEIVLDEYQNSIIEYDPVCVESGAAADLNYEKGKRWNALYYTKCKDIGSPICLNDENIAFHIEKNNTIMPSGYTALNCFNEVTPANANANTRAENAPALYMYYHTEADSDTHINEGEAADTNGMKYLAGIMLSSGKSETEAKAGILRKGYSILDVNLSPSIDEGYTYLGYSVTASENLALRDIRMASRYAGDQFLYGKASYSCSGKTLKGDGLFYTAYKNACEPILADFQVVHSASEAKEGYEPISLFGGVPFNFDMPSLYGNTIGNKNVENYHASYVYYRPSVMYPDQTENGASTRYVAGFTVLVGRTITSAPNNVRKFAEQFSSSIGGVLVPCSLNSAMKASESISSGGPQGGSYHIEYDMESYLCYTTTCNPSRAIYDINSYTAAPLSETCFPFIGSPHTGVYAAFDVVYDLYGADYRKIGSTTTHDYLNLYVGADDSLAKFKDDMLPEDFELPGYWDAPYAKAQCNVTWEASDVRCKALYGLGKTDGKAPLTEHDIIVTSSNLISERKNGQAVEALDKTAVNAAEFVSVQDAKTPNADAPHNLAYRSKSTPSDECYLFLRGSHEEQMYISAISVASFNREEYIKKMELEDDQVNYQTIEQINKLGDDSCISTLLGSCTDEILPYDISKYNVTNLIEDSTDWTDWTLSKLQWGWSGFIGFLGFTDSEASYERDVWEYDKLGQRKLWQNDSENYLSDTYSYLGVSRTSRKADAITGIIKYKPTGKTINDTIQIAGAEYHRCGDKVIDPVEGEYYLYTTKDASANPGVPITAIDINALPITEGAATALTGSTLDTKDQTASLTADAKAASFLHLYYDSNYTNIQSIYLGHGKNVKEAMCDLLSMSCNNALMFNLNRGSDGEYVLLGYTMCKANKRATNVVRDVMLTIGEPPHRSFTHNDIKYIRAIDEYTFSTTPDKAVSMNIGSNGEDVYLYYTTQTSKTLNNASPIAKFGIAERDRVPEITDNNGIAQGWENLLTNHGERYNLNDGLICYEEKDDEQVLADGRFYLYLMREDMSIKNGGRITGGHCEEMTQYGELYLTPNK